MGNLNLPQIAANQSQKHQTSNDADEYLDVALTDIESVDLSSAGVTLTNAQFREHFVFVSSGNTVPRTITVPQLKRPFIVKNGGSDTLTIARGSTSKTLSAGESALFFTDGTADGLAQASTAAGTVTNPYDVGTSYVGSPSASAVLMRYPFPRAVTFPANLTGSQAVCGTSATATADFDIRKNNVSVGTIRFTGGSPSAYTATFVFASQQTFNAGDVLTIVAPASPDATLADIGIGLAGTR